MTRINPHATTQLTQLNKKVEIQEEPVKEEPVVESPESQSKRAVAADAVMNFITSNSTAFLPIDVIKPNGNSGNKGRITDDKGVWGATATTDLANCDKSADVVPDKCTVVYDASGNPLKETYTDPLTNKIKKTVEYTYENGQKVSTLEINYKDGKKDTAVKCKYNAQGSVTEKTNYKFLFAALGLDHMIDIDRTTYTYADNGTTLVKSCKTDKVGNSVTNIYAADGKTVIKEITETKNSVVEKEFSSDGKYLMKETSTDYYNSFGQNCTVVTTKNYQYDNNNPKRVISVETETVTSGSVLPQNTTTDINVEDYSTNRDVSTSVNGRTIAKKTEEYIYNFREGYDLKVTTCADSNGSVVSKVFDVYKAGTNVTVGHVVVDYSNDIQVSDIFISNNEDFNEDIDDLFGIDPDVTIALNDLMDGYNNGHFKFDDDGNLEGYDLNNNKGMNKAMSVNNFGGNTYVEGDENGVSTNTQIDAFGNSQTTVVTNKSVVNYEYDGNDTNPCKETTIFYDKKGNPVSQNVTTKTYENGRVVGESTTHYIFDKESGEFKTSYTNEYTYAYDADGNVTNKTTVTKDKDGNKTTETVVESTYENGKIKTRTTTYKVFKPGSSNGQGAPVKPMTVVVEEVFEYDEETGEVTVTTTERNVD